MRPCGRTSQRGSVLRRSAVAASTAARVFRVNRPTPSTATTPSPRYVAVNGRVTAGAGPSLSRKPMDSAVGPRAAFFAGRTPAYYRGGPYPCP